MSVFKKLINNNEGLEFVVHIQNKEELDELVTALEELDFEYAIPLGTISEIAEEFVQEDGYDGCWRVSRDRGVAYNPSIEHWKLFTNDIVEVRDGKIQFHDNYASKEAIEIEKAKLRKAFFEEDEEANLQLFGLENATAQEIEEWLSVKFDKNE